jgi:hypothetical protein
MVTRINGDDGWQDGQGAENARKKYLDRVSSNHAGPRFAVWPLDKILQNSTLLEGVAG